MNKGKELRNIYEKSYNKINQDKKNIKDFVNTYGNHLKKDKEDKNRKQMERYIIEKEEELNNIRNKSEEHKRQIIEKIEKMISKKPDQSSTSYFKITTPIFEDTN